MNEETRRIAEEMKTKSLDELVDIIADGQKRKEKIEHEFRILVVKSLIRIEKQLDAIAKDGAS